MPDSSYKEVYNYAIGERYEPGSTFKTISLLAAIDDGLIDLDESSIQVAVHGVMVHR